MKNLSRLGDELAKRGQAMPDISAKVDDIKRRFQGLDAELSGVLAHGVRPINVATSSDNGVRSAPAYPSQHNMASNSSRPVHRPDAPPARGHPDDRIIHTRFCGVRMGPVDEDQRRPRLPPRAPLRNPGNFLCINCNQTFINRVEVYKHFDECVEDRGNPNGACWFDHPSINKNTLPESLLV